MYVVYLNNEVIGKLSKNQTLKEFLREEFLASRRFLCPLAPNLQLSQ